MIRKNKWVIYLFLVAITLLYLLDSTDVDQSMREKTVEAKVVNSNNITYSTITLLPTDWSIENRELGGKNYNRIVPLHPLIAEGAWQDTNIAGAPSLPIWRMTFASASQTGVVVDYRVNKWSEYKIAAPLPALGFTRKTHIPTSNPQPSAIYNSKEIFPKQQYWSNSVVKTGSKFRQNLMLAPFRYDFKRRSLFVAESISLTVSNINLDHNTITSTSITGSSDLETIAVITTSEFRPDLADWIKWKNCCGYKVDVYNYPVDTGIGAINITNFVKTLYDNEGCNYLLIIGDQEDVPAEYVPFDDPYGTVDNILSDVKYAMVAGDDEYLDIPVGRIAISDTTELSRSLANIIAYDQGIDSDKYASLLAIASDESGFIGYPQDNTIMDQQCDKLSSYESIEKIYQDDVPAPTTSELSANYNYGIGLELYLGHGTSTQIQLGNMRFNATNALNLAMPFPPVVAHFNCQNGDFSQSVSLAEAYLRTGDGSSSFGASAVLSSTELMDWKPPVEILKRFVDNTALGSEINLGTIFNDSYYAGLDWILANPDDESFDNFYTTNDAFLLLAHELHLFGDPTMRLRSSRPEVLDVEQPQNWQVGTNSLIITQAGEPVKDARVTIYYSTNDFDYVITDENGIADITRSKIDAATLTVSHSSAITYSLELDLISYWFTEDELASGIDIASIDGDIVAVVDSENFEIVNGKLQLKSGVELPPGEYIVDFDLASGGSVTKTINIASYDPDLETELEFAYYTVNWDAAMNSELFKVTTTIDKLQLTTSDAPVFVNNQRVLASVDFGGWQAEHKLTLTIFSGNRYCYHQFDVTMQYDFDYQVGWNLSGVAAVDIQLGDIATTNTIFNWLGSLYSIVDADTVMDSQRGFWLYADEEVNYSYIGVTRSLDFSDLPVGWSIYTPSAKILKSEIGGTIWLWSVENSRYEEAGDYLLPTLGYWIFVE